MEVPQKKFCDWFQSGLYSAGNLRVGNPHSAEFFGGVLRRFRVGGGGCTTDISHSQNTGMCFLVSLLCGTGRGLQSPNKTIFGLCSAPGRGRGDLGGVVVCLVLSITLLLTYSFFNQNTKCLL